eukprot:gene3544-4554_t
MHAAAAPAAEAGEAKWHGAQMDFSKSMSYGDYLGLYAQDTMSLTDTLKLVGGLRYDDFKNSYRNTAGSVTNEVSDSLVSPRVGLIFQPNELSSYYVSYGTSYNTSGDTYQFGNPGTTTARTANTDPEKSRNIEVGGKFELF